MLRQLAACARKHVRREELFARYGGEEFAVVLPETACESAHVFAERLREAVEAQDFEFEGPTIRVTVSLGVADTTGRETPSPEELISHADKALYGAKECGRNCVRVWADDEPPS